MVEFWMLLRETPLTKSFCVDVFLDLHFFFISTKSCRVFHKATVQNIDDLKSKYLTKENMETCY